VALRKNSSANYWQDKLSERCVGFHLAATSVTVYNNFFVALDLALEVVG